MSRAKKVLLTSFFLAMYLILKRMLVVRIPMMTFSFSFVPFILAAVILGPKYTVILGVLGDILGMILFSRGMFFPGYTLSAAISGYIYGSFLYTGDMVKVDYRFLIKLVISVLIVSVVVNLGLNTLWLSVMTGKTIRVFVPLKIFKQILLVPFRIFTMYLVTKSLEDRINTYKCSIGDELV